MCSWMSTFLQNIRTASMGLDIPDDMADIIRCFLRRQETNFSWYLDTVIKRKYKIWKSKRQEVIDLVDKQIEEFSSLRRNVNIASIVGSSVSLASGAASIAGLVLAPFTGGLSVALSVGGIAFFAAGTATAVGADIVEHVIKKIDLDKIEEAIKEDSRSMDDFLSSVKDLQRQEKQLLDSFKKLLDGPLRKYRDIIEERIVDMFDNIQNASSNADVVNKVCSSVGGIGLNVWITVGRLGREEAFFPFLKTAAQSSTRIASGVVFGFAMLMDVYSIYDRADEMISDKVTKEVENLKKLLKELKRQKEDISKYFDDLAGY